MSFRTGMVCTLWDLIDEGVEETLDCIHGELGAGRVVLPLATGPVVQLRPRMTTGHRIFRTTGGLHFAPDVERYHATRCKPMAADWLHGRHPAETAVQACRERGLEVWISLSVTQLGRMVVKHPEAAVKNVFGDLFTHRFCLLNGDVAELLSAMAHEITDRFEPDAIVLTGLCDFSSDWCPEAVDGAAQLGEVGRLLAGLCYCESCRQRGAQAGLDVDSAVRYTGQELARLLENGRTSDEPPGEWLESHRAVADWIAFRRGAELSWLAGLRSRIRCRVYLDLPVEGGSAINRSTGPVEDVHDQPMVLTVGHALDPVRAKEQLAELIQPYDVEQVSLQLPIIDPTAADGTGLVRSLSAAADLAIPSANLVHYGLMAQGRMQEVRQAIRFAVRRAC